MAHKHISREERSKIEEMLNAGKKKSEISRQLGRSSSSISNEINRNSVDGKYKHQIAHQKAAQKRANAKIPIITNTQWKTIEKLIKTGMSPVKISQHIKNDSEYKFSVSDQTIYDYVKKDKQDGGILYQYLARKGVPYKYQT